MRLQTVATTLQSYGGAILLIILFHLTLVSEFTIHENKGLKQELKDKHRTGRQTDTVQVSLPISTNAHHLRPLSKVLFK